MKKRKLYEKPTMKVVELKHRTTLLTTSSERPDYVPTEWN
jgi:hypothetical protein